MSGMQIQTNNTVCPYRMRTVRTRHGSKVTKKRRPCSIFSSVQPRWKGKDIKSPAKDAKQHVSERGSVFAKSAAALSALAAVFFLHIFALKYSTRLFAKTVFEQLQLRMKACWGAAPSFCFCLSAHTITPSRHYTITPSRRHAITPLLFSRHAVRQIGICCSAMFLKPQRFLSTRWLCKCQLTAGRVPRGAGMEHVPFDWR